MMKTTNHTNARGRRLRLCALEVQAFTVEAVSKNIKTLAKLNARARAKGLTRTTAWLGERLEYWGQFLTPAEVASLISEALA